MLLATCLSLLLLVIAFEPVATTKTRDLVNYNGELDTKPADAKRISAVRMFLMVLYHMPLILFCAISLLTA